MSPEEGEPEGEQPVARFVLVRIARHVRWLRTQGIGRLVEEDQLNPFERVPLTLRKWRWRRAHTVVPMAVPVFLVGVQRSGTNMLVRGLERSPEFEVRNENDRAAFHRFRLRPSPVIRALVERSGHPYVLFKPLADSHRIVQLLDALGTPSPPRAIWAYRSVDGRVRSAVAKFGANNSIALRAIAEGSSGHRLRADAPSQETIDHLREGLSAKSLALVRSFDYDELTPESGSALLWYVRNALYFELGAHERDDVMLSSYDALVEHPQETMRALCAFLRFPFHPDLVAHMQRRSGPSARLKLHPEIRRRCDGLQTRLDEAAREKAARFVSA